MKLPVQDGRWFYLGGSDKKKLFSHGVYQVMKFIRYSVYGVIKSFFEFCSPICVPRGQVCTNVFL